MSSSKRRSRSQADLLDPILVLAIQQTSYRLSRQNGFRRSEFADLQQALFQGLAERSRSFRPNRGSWRGFALTVIGNLAKSIRRSRLAVRRSPLLERPIRGNWSSDRRRPNLDLDPDAEDRRLDLAVALAELPPKLRALADCLCEGNVSAAARRLGLSRRSARDQLGRLRRRFEEVGLQNYC